MLLFVTIFSIVVLDVRKHIFRGGGHFGGHPLVKQVVTLSFNAKVDLADF